VKETGKPVSMYERDVHGEGRPHNRPFGVQTTGLAKVLADMLRSALSWEDAHGLQSDLDKNDKEVTASRTSDVSCSPRCDMPPDKDARFGQVDDDGVQGPAADV
jgi:hypothetical protein